MSVTVLERIALVLVGRLENMAAIGTYPSEILRPTRLNTSTPKHLQVILTQGSAKVIGELSYPGNPPAIAREVTFNIRCHVMSDEQSNEPIETIINTFAADVVKCVCTQTEWYNMDGLAINAIWVDTEDINADGGIDGVNVPLSIIYRTSENDPYAVRA
jgi:hypothetical protein